MTRRIRRGPAALAGLALLAAAAQFYTARAPEQPAPAAAPRPALSPLFAMLPVPDLRFADGAGRALSLADFRGRVVLLNLWATWCAPCREEMPALDRLQARLGGSGFEVVALSVDQGGPEAVRAFYDDLGLDALGVRLDASGEAMRALGVAALPTTLLIDASGREVGRFVGAAEWDDPETVALIRRHLEAAPAAPSR